MTDTELIHQVHQMAHDFKRRNTDWQNFFRNNTEDNVRVMLEYDARARREGRATPLPDPDLPPPATPSAVQAAEDAIGFPFPPLLTRLWTEVANGGFGPAGGIFGVEGGHYADEHRFLTIAPFYLDMKQSKPWPERLLPICYWGGDDYSAIDCTTADGDVVDLLEGKRWMPKRKKMTFAQWMEAWVNGVKL